jgi:hypothetical protein
MTLHEALRASHADCREVGSSTHMSPEAKRSGTTTDIDRLAVHYPDPDRPWNLIFATKIWLVGFIISAHAFYESL